MLPCLYHAPALGKVLTGKSGAPFHPNRLLAYSTVSLASLA